MKKILSIALCVIMLFSTMALGIVPAGAEGTATSSCPAKITNVNAYDKNGLFQYIAEGGIECSSADYIKWAGSKDYLGMFDGDPNTYTLVKVLGKSVPLTVVLTYKEEMPVESITINLNGGANSKPDYANAFKQTKYKIEISTDKESWEEVKAGDVGQIVDNEAYNAALREELAKPGGNATNIKIENYTSYESEFSAKVNKNVKYVRVSASGGDYYGEISEISTYVKTGHDYTTLDESASVAQTCTTEGKNVYKCACGATKEVVVPMHTLANATITKQPTTKNTGIEKGMCSVCNTEQERVLPVIQLSDSQKQLDLNNVTFVQDIKSGEEEKDGEKKTYEPSKTADPKYLFDGITTTSAWSPSNIWCGTGWGSTADTWSTLTIEFDQEYTLLMVKLYAWSNDNAMKIEFKNAAGEVVYEETNNNLGMYDESYSTPILYTNNVKNKDVKSIVITVLRAKGTTGDRMHFTELEVVVHECAFNEADKTNVELDATKCKETFDATCIYCETARTAAVAYKHTFEKEADGTTDKIKQTVSEVSCFQRGEIIKHCTVCNADVSFVTQPTGIHKFEKGEEVVLEKNNCGVDGSAQRKCETPNCPERTEVYTLKATGEHNYQLKEIEGKEADYTHEGEKHYICSVCSNVDNLKGTVKSEKKTLNCIKTDDYSIRYTDFVSPRATFKINLKTIKGIEDEYDVKIFGVAVKGEQTKEIQVYGEGKTGTYNEKTGEFSLVVKGSEPTDEYVFSVRVEIKAKSDKSTGGSEILPKKLSTNPDGKVSAVDVAYYYASNETRLNDDVPTELHDFYKELGAMGITED